MLTKRRLPFVLAALAAVAVPVLAVAPTVAAGPRTYVIKAKNIAYSPSRLTIHRGDRVKWEFLDKSLLSPHTVTSEGKQRFKDSPNPRLTGSFTATFTKAGTYKFICTVHPASMSGVITVR